MKKIKSTLFKTKDLYLAAVLQTLGHKVVSLKEEQGYSGYQVKYFTFESKKELDEDVTRFWNNELKVMAKDLYDNVQALKDWLRAVNKET